MRIVSINMLVLCFMISFCTVQDDPKTTHNNPRSYSWDKENHVTRIKKVEFANVSELRKLATELLELDINMEANTIAQYYIYKADFYSRSGDRYIENIESIYHDIKQQELIDFRFDIDMLLYNHYFIERNFEKAVERLKNTTEYIFSADRKKERLIIVYLFKDNPPSILMSSADIIKEKKSIIKAFEDEPWSYYKYLINRQLATAYAYSTDSLSRAYDLYDEYKQLSLEQNFTSIVADINFIIGYLKSYIENEDNTARDYIEESVRLLEESGHTYNLDTYYRVLGHVYLNLKNAKKALEYYEKAIDLNKMDNIEEAAFGYSYAGWALMKISTDNYDKAESYFQKAIELSDEQGEAYKLALERKMWSLTAINEHEKAKEIQKTIESLNSQQKYFEAKLKNATTSTHAEIRLKDFKIQELNLLNKIQDERLAKHRIIGTLSILIVMYCALLVYHFYRKNKYFKSINSKSKIIEEQNLALTESYQSIEEKNLELESELKNQLLLSSDIRQKLNKIESQIKKSNISDSHKNKLIATIKTEIPQSILDNIDHKLLKTNEVFFNKLSSVHPNLTKNDLILSALIKMNLRYKEIATIQYKSPSTVKIATYRLKSKLMTNSQHEIHNLSTYLNSLN